MAIFQKTMVYARQNEYSDYKSETARVDTDFVINAGKNVSKSYKFKTTSCFVELIVRESTENAYIVVKPGNSGGDPTHGVHNTKYYEVLDINPSSTFSRCESTRIIPQVPFVLGTRGVLFRRRSTPYFTTMGNPEGYIE